MEELNLQIKVSIFLYYTYILYIYIILIKILTNPWINLLNKTIVAIPELIYILIMSQIIITPTESIYSFI